MKDREKLTLWMNRISQTTFYLALFIELTIVILDKSAYIIQYEGLWFRLTFVLFGISIFIFVFFLLCLLHNIIREGFHFLFL